MEYVTACASETPMPCACSGTTLSRGKERTQQRVVQHLVEASPHPSSACALVELCHRVGKGGQQQAARRGEYRGRVSCNAGRSRARAVRKASRRVNSTEHEVNQKRSLIHVSKTKEIAHLRGISAGKTRASGVRGEPGSTAWRLPGGRRSHDTRMVRRRIPLAMPFDFCRAIPP